MNKLLSTKELHLERNRRYRERHADKIAERHRLWVIVNPQKRAAHLKKYRLENAEKLREERKLWRKNNPEKAKNLVRSYQARKMNATVGVVDYELILKKSKMICGICDLIILGRYEFDHIVPLVVGGEHSQDNLQIAHPLCNQVKCTKPNFKLVNDPKVVSKELSTGSPQPLF